jgi:hypothetical protein
MSDNTLIGKKVILFEFLPADLEHFVKLHREDKLGFMQDCCLKKMTEDEAKNYVRALVLTGQIQCWSVYTKDGKNSHRAGFIYLGDKSSFSCQVSGIMDNEFAKGITKRIREGKYTYSEDALRVILDYCFNKLNFIRVASSILPVNKRALALSKKAGFEEEGIMRKSFKLDDDVFSDVVKLAILKEEYQNGKEQ